MSIRTTSQYYLLPLVKVSPWLNIKSYLTSFQIHTYKSLQKKCGSPVASLDSRDPSLGRASAPQHRAAPASVREESASLLEHRTSSQPFPAPGGSYPSISPRGQRMDLATAGSRKGDWNICLTTSQPCISGENNYQICSVKYLCNLIFFVCKTLESQFQAAH